MFFSFNRNGESVSWWLLGRWRTCRWSVKHLSVGRWSVVCSRWVGGRCVGEASVGGSVVGGRWPVGGRWSCNTPISKYISSKQKLRQMIRNNDTYVSRDHFSWNYFLEMLSVRLFEWPVSLIGCKIYDIKECKVLEFISRLCSL